MTEGRPPRPFLVPRTVEVDGEEWPLASLLRRGAALAVDLCAAVAVAAVAIWVLSFSIPLDTAAARDPILAICGVIALYILWLRDRGPSRSRAELRYGPSLGRRLFGLPLVSVPGFFFRRAMTVSEAISGREADTALSLRAGLIGIAASLLSLLLLGQAVSRTTVFLAVLDHVERTPVLVSERAGTPLLAAVPTSLLIGRERAWVRVDVEWEGAQSERAPGEALEFFLARGGATPPGNPRAWQVVEVRLGVSTWLRDYSLLTRDEEIPTP